MTSRPTPTMKDVAKEAGVSLGTVSKVMNGLPVGESYRKRVEAAAAKLGYQVNIYARGLKAQINHFIILMMPTLRHPYFAALADELTAALMREGYRPFLTVTNYDPATEEKCISMVRQNMAGGIIALTYNPELKVDPSIPFVTIDRHCNAKVPCISADNFGGGRMAAEKLIERGCKKLLFMRIGSAVSSEVDKRSAGFEYACRIADVDFDSIYLDDEDTEEPFYEYLREHVKDGKADFDGIFCNTDKLACLVRNRLVDAGVRVPEDVQIIGFDGIPDYITGKPKCSTIVQPIDLIAQTAVKTLIDNDPYAKPALMALPVHYIAGGTTKEEKDGE